MPTPVCANCGAVFEADARFCGACGTRLMVAGATTAVDLVSSVAAPEPAPIAAASVPSPSRPARAPSPPAPPRPNAEAMVGRTLNGRYLVQRKIGHGGFGAVYQGKQIATGREVALKVLHPQNVTDQTVVARFRREAEACSQLRRTTSRAISAATASASK